jgi:hypothetical protein
MSAEEFGARTLGQFHHAALEGLSAPYRIIDYDELNVHTIYEIATLCGVTLPPQDAPDIRKLLSTYAKDPLRERPFVPDRERKAALATTTTKAFVERWARPAYERLRQKARQSGALCASATIH